MSILRDTILLRGETPRIFTNAYSLGIGVCKADSNASSTFNFLKGQDVKLRIHCESNTNQVQVGVTGLVLSELGSNTWPSVEPSISFRTTSDREVLNLGSSGVVCNKFTANVYNALASNVNDTNAFIPPSAYALSDAYYTLSNLIAVRTTSNTNILQDIGLVNSFLSTSVFEAPTASALRAAYLTLSNQMAINMYQYKAQVQVQTTSNTTVLSGTSSSFPTDTWIPSVPDIEPRFYFESGRETILSATPSETDSVVFRFRNNMSQMDVATMHDNGDLHVQSSIKTGGNIHLGENVVVTHHGSNIGVNLPQGVPPLYTLHVNGTVFSTEHVFSLSDVRVKENIQRIDDALGIVDSIGGYTYTMNGRRCVGVLAQEVQKMIPEAVSCMSGSNNLLSVSYDSLVGVLFEAVRKMRTEIDELRKDCLQLRHHMSPDVVTALAQQR
jgi:hypothetical protein